MSELHIQSLYYKECVWDKRYPQVATHYKINELAAVLKEPFNKGKCISCDLNLTLKKPEFEYFNSIYPEELVSDPITDLHLFSTWGPSRKYPFVGKYLPLNINKKVSPNGSNSAKEALGSSVMGLLIESFSNVKPIVRNVQRAPDLICLGDNNSDFIQFWEAKCQEKISWSTELGKIYHDLTTGFCNISYLVNTKIESYYPLKVDIFVYKFFLNEPIGISSIEPILLSLEEEIKSSAIATGTVSKRAFQKLLLPNGSADEMDCRNKILLELIEKEDATKVFRELDGKIKKAKAERSKPESLEVAGIEEYDHKKEQNFDAYNVLRQSFDDIFETLNESKTLVMDE